MNKNNELSSLSDNIPKKQQYFYSIIFIFILILPNILLISIGEDSAVGSLLKKGVFFLISLSIVILPLTILKPKHYSYLVILCFPIILFEVYHIFQFKTPSSEEIIASIFLTNINETKEILQTNFIFFITTLSTFILLIWVSIKIDKSFLVGRKKKKIILLFFSLIFISLGIRNVKLALNKSDKNSEIIRSINYSFSVQLRKNFPTGFILKTFQVFNGFKKKKEYLSNTKDFKFNTIKKDTLNENEIYVLVIGETARKHNFHIYGYPKNTTPNLDSIQNLLTFKNVNSNANVTSLSIPFMLTRATPKNPEKKYNEPTIINAFKEAGFSTYWISNQQIATGSIFRLYSQSADYYKNVSKSLDAAGFDENVLPVFDDVLKDSNKKKFIIIHTIGSHFRYNYRYPKHFKHFTPTLKKGLSIENTTNFESKSEIINSYDNSIIYTDFILNEVIKKLEAKNTNSFMYYISDHGENLFDTNKKKLLHGFEVPTKFETEIPLLIWTSDKYNINYPKKTEALHKNINDKIATINTFYTLLDLGNVTYPNFELHKSFANQKFDTLQESSFFTVNKSVLKLD
jgi:glucan phosphoethanolaminetransferase (alkaline phosphatase superfamily)